MLIHTWHVHKKTGCSQEKFKHFCINRVEQRSLWMIGPNSSIWMDTRGQLFGFACQYLLFVGHNFQYRFTGPHATPTPFPSARHLELNDPVCLARHGGRAPWGPCLTVFSRILKTVEPRKGNKTVVNIQMKSETESNNFKFTTLLKHLPSNCTAF